jgi:membrane-associated protease RseP (regulator of RpoE activity)
MLDALKLLLIYVTALTGIYFLGKLLHAEKHGIAAGPLYLMYKTNRWNRLLERIAVKRRNAWRTLWNIGIALGISLTVYMFYYLSRNVYSFFYKPHEATAIMPLLPGLTITAKTLPYVLLAIIVVIITHEFSHGIASLADGVQIKSIGFLLAFIIPAAFVEIDDEKLEEARNVTKLRVFAAGSSANMAVALLSIILIANFALLISPFYSIVPSGALITGLKENFPAQKAGMQTGDVIFGINDTRIGGVSDLKGYMAGVKPNTTLIIATDKGNFTVRAQADPENENRSIIGVYTADHYEYEPKMKFLPENLPQHIINAEMWIYIVSLSVALVNMLPFYPLDGDKFFCTVLKSLAFKRVKEIRILANAASIAILGLNLTLSFLVFGFMRV